MQTKKRSSIIKDAIALFSITLVAAIALGFVFEITKEPIAIAKAKAKEEAYAAVFQEAKSIDTSNEELIQRVGQSKDFLSEHGFTKSTINEVCLALDETGNVLGYVMTITSHEGYSGDIQFSLGIRSDGTLTKIQMLSIKETAGLGMKANEKEFKNQFTEIKTDAFSVIKSQVEKTSESEINAISGATITSKAVTNTVNAGLEFANDLLDNGIGGVVRE